MAEKLTRRQLIKLLALATGTSIVAYTKLYSSLKTMAQVVEKEDVFLPIIKNPDPTATLTAPTATLTATNTPTPLPGSGTFIDGPGGNVNTAKDMLMSSSWAINNGGQHANFQLEGPPGAIQHALLEFDLSTLPSSRTCLTAKLYLYHSYNGGEGGIHTGNVYSVARANASWIEGMGDIDLARRGEPCWNALEANGSGGVQKPWAGSPGCSTSGVDYEANSMGSWSFNGSSPLGTEVEIELDTNRVQGWFGSSNSNNGIILVSDNIHGVHVGSSENPTSSLRPKLVVTYS